MRLLALGGDVHRLQFHQTLPGAVGASQIEQRLRPALDTCGRQGHPQFHRPRVLLVDATIVVRQRLVVFRLGEVHPVGHGGVKSRLLAEIRQFQMWFDDLVKLRAGHVKSLGLDKRVDLVQCAVEVVLGLDPYRDRDARGNQPHAEEQRGHLPQVVPRSRLVRLGRLRQSIAFRRGNVDRDGILIGVVCSRPIVRHARSSQSVTRSETGRDGRPNSGDSIHRRIAYRPRRMLTFSILAPLSGPQPSQRVPLDLTSELLLRSLRLALHDDRAASLIVKPLQVGAAKHEHHKGW